MAFVLPIALRKLHTTPALQRHDSIRFEMNFGSVCCDLHRQCFNRPKLEVIQLPLPSASAQLRLCRYIDESWARASVSASS